MKNIQPNLNRIVCSLVLLSGIILSSCTETNKEVNSDKKQRSSKTHTYLIDASESIAKIQPTMYGVFFEDINFAADGGIYAEMVKNRSFEFDILDIGWSQPESDKFSLNKNSGFASIVKRHDNDVNAHYMRVITKSDTGYRLTNEGFRGMGVKKDLTYNLSFMARNIEGVSEVKIELASKEGQSLGSTTLTVSGGDWSEYSASFSATKTEEKAVLNLWFIGEGVTDVDMISLFPSDTWMDRPKGMRKDLVQLLADLNPGFLRFPGGCIVEGRILERRYQWKKTVGPIADRAVMVNRWNTEFRHRLTPDYYQSFGLGYFEYFQLSEDMNAEPLPILSCGIACQFNTGELAPMDELDPYVADALDLIEFANGSTTSLWGKVRAEMGHPEPFDLKYIGIGNEQWGPEYIKRYTVFEKAIKAKYPEIIIVSGSGPFPDGEMFDYGWEQLKEMGAEIVDEHYYRDPEWFLENADRYDSYDREGPKVFAGEYAAQSEAIASPENRNNWECALSEAAFMTGLERNADVIHLTSYAPLFAHAEGWQWTPDLIWFNNLKSYATPNYYVQKLFSTNPGTDLMVITEDQKPVIGAKGLYASATKDTVSGELIIKYVNTNPTSETIDFEMQGNNTLGKDGSVQVLRNDNLEAENGFESMDVAPVKTEVAIAGSNFQIEAAAYSVNVLRIPFQ